MTDDELERRLRDAFAAKAQSDVPETRVPPPLDLSGAARGGAGGSADGQGWGPTSHRSVSRRSVSHRSVSHRAPTRRGRWLAPLAAAASVVFVAGVVAVTMNDRNTAGPGAGRTQAVGGPTALNSQSPNPGGPSSVSSASSGTPSPSDTTTRPSGKPVKVISSVLSDGSQVGVGMPIILLLSHKIKDARGFAQATAVTVNGKAVHGGWYFERKYQDKGHPIEADYRTRAYWPAHAHIHFELHARHVSAGKGLYFKNNLSLDFTTGAANVLTVNDATHRLTVMSDGKQWPNASTSFPVSLGASNTPTMRGTKVIMEKGLSICMHGPGYSECGIKYTQRLTYDGEYLHAAPWNCTGSPGCTGPGDNIGSGDSSNGCTNLTPTDARKLYHFLEIGDVVQFPNASGPLMSIGDGYGDWNVPWPQWQTGGLYPTH